MMKKSLVALGILGAFSISALSMESYDVVIVGSGGAGLTAAVTAKEAGASVLVLEKMPILGGNSNFSSGGMNAACTKQQIAAGVKDDPEIFFRDTMKGGHNLNDPDLVHVLTRKSAETEEWLLSIGAHFCFQNRRSGGMSIPRSHGPCDGSAVGIELMRALGDRIAKDGVEVRTSTRVTKIVMKDGHPVGVEAETAKGKQTIGAKAVVIAAGGFGANHAMVEKYRPELKGFSTTNHKGATGDGIKLGTDAGAAVRDMEQIQIHPTVIKRDGHLISESMRGRGAILVNTDGKRFTNELLTRDVVSQNELKQPGGAVWLIYDQSLFEKNKLSRGYVKDGYAVKGETLEELAKKMNVPFANLKATLDAYHGFYDKKKDEAFGRPDMLLRLDHAPYYAVFVTPGIHHTMGGLVINTKAEVQAPGKKTIPGLFAAGEVTGGVHGGNRIGGNAVADIVTFGRIAGTGAAAYAKAH